MSGRWRGSPFPAWTLFPCPAAARHAPTSTAPWSGMRGGGRRRRAPSPSGPACARKRGCAARKHSVGRRARPDPRAPASAKMAEAL